MLNCKLRWNSWTRHRGWKVCLLGCRQGARTPIRKLRRFTAHLTARRRWIPALVGILLRLGECQLGIGSQPVIPFGNCCSRVTDRLNLGGLGIRGQFRLCHRLTSGILRIDGYVLDGVRLRIKGFDLRRGSIEHQHPRRGWSLALLYSRGRQPLDDFGLMSGISMRARILNFRQPLLQPSQVFTVGGHLLLSLK